ncbi:unnamed protein product, partial [Rotaria sp. Silwood1]
MDEVIARAKYLIRKILKSRSSRYYTHLVDVDNLLNQLLEPNFTETEWTQLFCRQLKRLMDSNESIRDDIWRQWHLALFYIIEDPNGEQDKGNNWERFLERMNFERELKQRELQFQEQFKERKDLSQLFCEHNEFFKEYFQKCISFHSKVQVRGLINNIDDLLSKVYGLTEVFLTSESHKRLEKKLKSIEINLDCSNKLLNCYEFQSSTDLNSSKRVNNSLNTFLPSIELKEKKKNHKTKKIANVLQSNRWIVILGDPGSAKTTLLRWITRILAEAALHNDEEVVLEGNCRIPVRIPILIRIGEFAAWLNQHQTKTLIDYIGEHTWFFERYCDIDSGNVLKELVYHGHTLILLDGLDEILEVERKGEIVDLIRKFTVEYVRGPEFYTAFDHCMFETRSVFDNRIILEMQPPNKCGGNQIVVTSRIIGYDFHPLTGSLIQHCSLLLMNHEQAKEFINKWMTQVEKCILDDLLNEGIQIDEETVKILSKKRNTTVKAMFKNRSELLMSNPSLLSLFCTFIFKSFDQFQPTSRVEVYDQTVQAALHSWRNQEPCISESILAHFLIELATYLHLQSPSGLIDLFDMKKLCYLVLQQQGLSNDRTELRIYTNKLISLLDFNVGIAAERGLQVFGFLHLSLQEYFVAQALVRGSSIDEIVKRIVRFSIYPHFREPLLLALGWISWKWSFDEYNKFCNLLLTPIKDYIIPIGTFLFFDAFNDLIRLPSNSIIFTALNNLLYHSFGNLTSKYLLQTLPRLSDDIITEWMQLYLKDDKCLFNFCQYFTQSRIEKFYGPCYDQKLTSILYQQLWSYHNISLSAEFILDQILRGLMVLDIVTEQIFNKKLSLSLLSHDLCKSNIHPLILAVINAVCGGVHLYLYAAKFNISFSPKYMHRESSILAPIVKYLNNNVEPHSIKIQTLINDYQNFLEMSLPSNTSIDVVDTFIALICLQGLSQPSIYQKYKKYKALPLALERFKWIWFYLNDSCKHIRGEVSYIFDIDFFKNEIEPIINEFFPQPDPSDEQFSSFSQACAVACKKLRFLDISNLLKLDTSDKIDLDSYYQSEFFHFIDEKKLDLIAQNISSLKILEKRPFFLLNFLPQSLRQLYSWTIISPINKKDSLPLVVLLSQCLIYLENVDEYNSNFYLALVMLQPLLKEHTLENYASGLLWEKYFDTETIKSNATRKFLKAINDRKLFDPFHMDYQKNLELFIKVERQRISKANIALHNQDRDMKLFSTSISLARLYQTLYRIHKYKAIRHIGISHAESNDIHLAIMNILNPILRIIALNIILNMKDPLIFIEEQRDQLQWQMIFLLHSILPNLSLLTSTLLFVQCYTVHQMFPLSFEYMTNIIGQKLNEVSKDKQNQGQEAAYIALKQLNNLNLSPFLSEFAKRTINLSDVLHFNSTIFYHFLTNRTSFDSCNGILLSIMYLNELIFDVQSLKMYTEDDYKSHISPLKELEVLWNELSKIEKIMSFKVATWITNFLPILNKKEIHQIIEYICCCTLVEKNAISVIEKWLDYRNDQNIKIFAQYAALQLIIEGFNNSELMDILNDMIFTDTWFRLMSIVKRLFNSHRVNSSIFRQILIILHTNIQYFSKISFLIDCKKTFKLILDLEYERINSYMSRQSKMSTKPFLLIIKSCSNDLKLFLANYLRTFIIKSVMEEEYIAVVIKWIIENLIFDAIVEEYNYIFTLLHNQEFPRIQKAIINGLNSVFLRMREKQDDIFLQDAMKNLEKVICSWNIYPKDVLTICLLAYGNCLTFFNKHKMNRNVSDQTKNMLNILSETSFPEIIFIRASFCLIFMKQSFPVFHITLDWFKNKRNITSEEAYNILLNQTLYETRENSVGLSIEGFVEHVDDYMDSNNFMSTFVT